MIGIETSPIIIVLCLLIVQAIKATKKIKNEILPIISVVCGVVIGIAVFYALPELIKFENIASAVIVGGASGLAATGSHQIIKQLQKTKTK